MFGSGKSRADGFGGPRGGGRGGEGGPFGGRGGGRRMGRLFAHGDLHLVLLSLIAERPRHGYELIKSITVMANGVYSPSPGTIYPALTLLEEQGSIREEESEGSRKRYAITEEGRAYLAENAAPLEELRQRIALAGSAPEHMPPAPVIRAMENLKLALHMRLSREPLTDESVHAIAAALDRAASDVERS